MPSTIGSSTNRSWLWLPKTAAMCRALRASVSPQNHATRPGELSGGTARRCTIRTIHTSAPALIRYQITMGKAGRGASIGTPGISTNGRAKNGG